MNQRKLFGIAWLLVTFLLAGSLFAFAGVVYAFAPDTDLSNADASFWGEDSYDISGYSVASAGDVNGDGRDDFLIGAYGDDDGGSAAGQTYLILGRENATWGMNFNLSNADASFWGEDSGDFAGISVASAGDVNGDGRDDFLIGAPLDEDGGDDAGQTYLILGRAAADWGMDFNLSNANASFWGEDSDDRSGWSVASAGDVNGDGRDDFLIGAYLDEDGGSEAGQTYLILGREDADWGMDFNLSNADASFWGEDSYDYAGGSVASAGDVNGDGRDDFLIGAYYDETGGNAAGQTYLILGRAAADWGMDFDLSGANASFIGEDSYDISGYSVASAGDVNGDGRDDFLIGTPADEDGGDDAGQTYLILGRENASWGMDFDLSNANASFWGEDSGDGAGVSVASAGDVNGDGYDDFLIGAAYDDDGGDFAGQTYLILGRAAADWGMDFDLSGANASFWGEDSGDNSGHSVACAGDVNGDGRDDFLIGARYDEDGGTDAGQTYLLLGVGLACDCGDICVNETGWWRDGGTFNASATPIQSAVDNATGGDTICVKDGTYTENVDVNTANLTIKSENGTANCVVQASSSSDHVFYVTANWTNITGFTVKGATGNDKAGIYLSTAAHCNVSNNNAIDNWHGIKAYSSSTNNTITNNTASNNSHFGIELASSSNNNTLTNNTAGPNNAYGIVLSGSDSNTLRGNTASNNPYGYGIFLQYGSDNNTVSDNTCSNNDDAGILLRESSNNNTVTNNTASNNAYGIQVLASSNDNTLTNNIAKSNTNRGIYLFSSNNNNIYNNYFDNTNNTYDNGNNAWNTTKTPGTNIIGGGFLGGNYWSDYTGSDANGDGLGDTPYNIMGDSNQDHLPLVYPVCTCGDICVNETGWWRDGGTFNASATPIQSAVDNATGGDTICVKDGTYTENVDVNTANLTIQSENGAANCVVSASNSNDHVFEVTANWMNITGFTVKGATGNDKAGIYLSSAAHCNVSNNNAIDNRHGIVVTSSGSNTLTNNTASNNIHNGIRLQDGSTNNMVINNTVSNNTGGIRLVSSSNNTLTDNTCSNNSYGGIRLQDGSTNNTVINNTASNNIHRGIALWSSCNNTLTDNTASDNRLDGIGLVQWSHNNTLTDNTASNNDRYGIHLRYSSYNTLTDNTASNNTRHGIYLYRSRYNTLINNTASNNSLCDIRLYSSPFNTLNGNTIGRTLCIGSDTSLDDWIQDIDTSNTVDGKPVYYLVDEANQVINSSSNAGYVAVVNSTNITVKDLVLTNNGQGVLMCYTNNSRIENVTVSNNNQGIYLYSSSNNTLSNNTASNNTDGIHLDYSSNNTLTNNTMSGNNYTFGVRGSSLSHYIQDIDTSNKVDGKPTYYWVNHQDEQVPGDAGFVGIVNSTNITVQGLTLTKNGEGVLLAYTENSRVEDVTASNNEYGIYLTCSANNTLTNNTMSGNIYNLHVSGWPLSDYIQDIDTSNKVDGKPTYYWVNHQDEQVPGDAGFVGIVNSTNITVQGLTLTKNGEGVLLAYTENSRVEDVTASNNCYGIFLISSSNNTLMSNTAWNNTERGIYVNSSSSNTIYNNYFNNTSNAYDDGSNTWNITNTTGPNIVGGLYLGGNYWSDYSGNDTNGDGFGDTQLPYNCTGNITNGGDYLPLILTGATLEGNVTFPMARVGSLVEPFEVKLFESGNFSNVIWSGNRTTNSTGVFNITGLTSDTYDIGIKSAICVSEVNFSVTLGLGTNVVDFAIRSGDVDNSDYVDMGDYSAFSTAFNTLPSDPKWNANADLDRSGYIDMGDYSMFSTYFNELGDAYGQF